MRFAASPAGSCHACQATPLDATLMARTKVPCAPSTGGKGAVKRRKTAVEEPPDEPEAASESEADAPETDDNVDSSSDEMVPEGAYEAAKMFSKVNRLACRMVDAHIQGHLERKRLREYEKGRLAHDLQRCLEDAEPRMAREMKGGANCVGFEFEPKYRHYVPTEAEVQAALPEEILMFEQNSSFQWHYTLTFTWKDTPDHALQGVFHVVLHFNQAFLKAYRDEAHKNELEQRDSR